MAHHKSAKKRIRTNEKKRLQNRSVKSKVKTYIRYFTEALEAAEGNKDNAAAKEELQLKLRKAVSELHKSASKGILHKNTAGRKAGRLTDSFNKLFKA